MVKNPVVGNIYRVVSNVGHFGVCYHNVDIGKLVMCTNTENGTDVNTYRALGTDSEQFIYNHDLEHLHVPSCETSYMIYESVLQWADDRNILKGSTRKDQMVKLVEEIGELAGGIAKGEEDMVRDSIGDALVVLTIIAEQSGTSIAECLGLAWNEIKDRKGKMVDGIFIKEEDQ